jgi:NCS1 family nucleobase:cation symporter-1
MASRIRERVSRVKESLKEKRHVEGWILPKETSSFAPEGAWTNIDLDVVVPERRTWTSITIVGYWLSDIVRIFNRDQSLFLIRNS